MDQIRPHITVILAMSADGKITDVNRSPARFGSAADKAHLETQIARSDAVLFGAQTLRAYGTSLSITNRALLQQRSLNQQPPQPTHIVCSRSGQLSPDLPFFQQPIPRWLITAPAREQFWRDRLEFSRILTPFTESGAIEWCSALTQLSHLRIQTLLVMGGGQLIASLLANHFIDELWLTVCPLLLGGSDAPTPVEGAGFPASLAPRLHLLSVETIEQEVFLHYAVQR
ncbi:RibD family protein [Egbenema bharatensis]|uniref:RibD family protein n=1 Tax=Egbenema bharatensis TaxID=3463334 RepID=UPI003A88CC63